MAADLAGRAELAAALSQQAGTDLYRYTQEGGRVTLSVLLLVLGAALAIGSFRRWLAAERALRRGDELPVTALAPVVSAGLAIVAVVLVVVVLLR